MNEKDVINAALMIEKWCKEHRNLGGNCNCPFFTKSEEIEWDCFLQDRFEPGHWFLEEFLENKG
jgi:hypothetical protein